MERFYTTVKQAKKLLDLGVKPLTADLYFGCFQSLGQDFHFKYPSIIEDGQRLNEKDVPCWSIGALFTMMPSYIEYNGEYCFIKTGKTRNGFMVECSNNRGYIAFCKDCKTLIDGLYQLLCWLVKNDYLKP